MFLTHRTGTTGKDGSMTTTVTDSILRALSAFRAVRARKVQPTKIV